MGWRDLFIQKKSKGVENNYKLDLFNVVSQSEEIANMSTIKKYFNSLYDTNDSFAAFSVGQSLDDAYVAESTNKIARLQEYRNMAKFQEVRTVCRHDVLLC
jgi:hypothetical protein